MTNPTTVPDTGAPDPAAAPMAAAAVTPSARRKITQHPLPVTTSFIWMALLLILILIEPLLPLPDPTRTDYRAIAVPPGHPDHILGTDEIGRDILARLIVGARVSLIVGVAAVAVATFVGSVLGMIAGYFGGIVNRIISGLVDILLAFPALVALIALGVFMGPGLVTIIIGIGLILSPAVARVARSATMMYAKRDFVTAARGMGMGHLRILLREVLPNVVVPVLSYAMVLVAVAIVAEASLSFLGLGVPPPASSWGSMMGSGRSELNDSPHIVLLPAAVMFVTLLSLNFLAEHFGKRFDIKEAAL
ncbi:MAG: ABC transporter permease [Propionibacteriaceae bacterium]|nr:ABC transporter permease [Propionibacteriaceae bacterium]